MVGGLVSPPPRYLSFSRVRDFCLDPTCSRIVSRGRLWLGRAAWVAAQVRAHSVRQPGPDVGRNDRLTWMWIGGSQMIAGEVSVAAFTAFGIASQAILVCFFAAQRWSPQLAPRYGRLAYAFAGLGLPLGAWLFLDGQSWRLYLGPLLMAAWALFGAVVDLWRPRQGVGPSYGASLRPTWRSTSGLRCAFGGPLGYQPGGLGGLPRAVCGEHRVEPARALRRWVA